MIKKAFLRFIEVTMLLVGGPVIGIGVFFVCWPALKEGISLILLGSFLLFVRACCKSWREDKLGAR